ncbi:MAG: ATP-dependent sacrificial sulfur transferase LarE [bacterium]|nr:ATP-dependent sacrificial sulfur transferase LarE [bacterium]
MKIIDKKLDILKTNLKKFGSVVVAYSGGVDSTLLLKVAKDTLPSDKVLAVTGSSVFYPDSEIEFAKKMAKKLSVKHIVIEENPLNNPKIYSNPEDRCYWCKSDLFAHIAVIAKTNNLNYILDGTNSDDIKDFRPGMKACKKYNVYSPLKDSKLSKRDIRILSKEYGLPTWDKPAFPCLASRFPYGDKITGHKLKMVELAEKYLLDLGLKEVRVRHHSNIARIEVKEKDINFFINAPTRKQIVKKFKAIGYAYVTLDIEGYRTGSMNISRDCSNRKFSQQSS